MNFNLVDISNMKEIIPYFHTLNKGISEYSFNLLFLWKYVYKPSYSIDNDIFYLIQTYKKTQYALMPICLKHQYEEAFVNIYNYIKEKETQFTMYCVEKEFADFIKDKYGDKFDVYPDRDTFDYIYDGDDLRTLSGKKYHKKRNHINSFLEEYEGRYVYQRLCKDDLNDCLQMLSKWKEHKPDSSYEQTQGEILGIKSIFDNIEHLDLKIGGIYIDGILEAFTIGSDLYNNNEMIIVHVEKANPDIRGLYPYINQQFLINEFAGAKLINREEDLGIEGIRQAKMSYRPLYFAEKYDIIEKI